LLGQFIGFVTGQYIKTVYTKRPFVIKHVLLVNSYTPCMGNAYGTLTSDSGTIELVIQAIRTLINGIGAYTGGKLHTFKQIQGSIETAGQHIGISMVFIQLERNGRIGHTHKSAFLVGSSTKIVYGNASVVNAYLFVRTVANIQRINRSYQTGYVKEVSAGPPVGLRAGRLDVVIGVTNVGPHF